jgi:hypothetical protein
VHFISGLFERLQVFRSNTTGHGDLQQLKNPKDKGVCDFASGSEWPADFACRT